MVGIARVFLGSGARSVLVTLWTMEDKATKQFMSHFYEHLVREESASEFLRQAMRWMRENGFSEVREWAPFMLIGDNVSFDFPLLTLKGKYILFECGLNTKDILHALLKKLKQFDIFSRETLANSEKLVSQ